MVSLYIFTSLIFFFYLQYLSQLIISNKLHCENSVKLCLVTIFITFVLPTAIRCAFNFRKCRPEQDWCYNLENIINQASDSMVNNKEVFTKMFFRYGEWLNTCNIIIQNLFISRFLFPSGCLVFILAIQSWNIWPDTFSFQLMVKQMFLWMSSLLTILYWWTTHYRSDVNNLVYIYMAKGFCR